MTPWSMSSSLPREGALHVVPVCHDRMEFAQEVRRAILSIRPAAVAIELHPEVREAFLEAVKRLPFLSYIEQAGLGEELPLVINVEPTDPFVEAVRTSSDAEIGLHFVDLSVQAYPAVYEPMPDSYALRHVGLSRFYDAYAKVAASPVHPLDEVRERHMAARLCQLLDAGGEVVFVCGMAHVERVMRHVRERSGVLGEAAPVGEVTLLNPDLEVIRATSSEIPFLMACYEADRKGLGDERFWQSRTPPEPPIEAPTQLESLTQADVFGALESLLGMGPKNEPQQIALTPQLLRALSKKLGGMKDPRTILGLLGVDPNAIPRLASVMGPPGGAQRVFTFRSVDDRRPALREIYSDASRLRGGPHRTLDRQRVAVRMLTVAGRYYEENTGETLKGWQMRTLLQFIRSWCRVRGRLLPRQWWDWTVAARGVADDNYAYEVWDLASFYPWVDESQTHRGLDLEGFTLRHMRFRRRWPSFRERFMKAPTRPRKQEPKPGDWASEFESGTICSYPPEDIIIEDYGRYLKKKAVLVLSEERTRVEPFSTSLLDGIDVRETIRNWPRAQEGGGRIYVRESQRVKGGTGSVVVIFDDDLDDTRFPWKVTWHGEHDQESDMAFYATPIHAKIVGPGIARCEYGGLLLSYPPRRLYDIWSDPFYEQAQSKAEILLMAALEYAKEKHVVYVAAKPPRSLFRTLANRVGRKIVYLPIGQLSPVSLKKLRVFHVLSGHHVREIAKDYIW